jgi:hypothetical protein
LTNNILKKHVLKSIIGFWLGHWLDELKIFVLTEIKKDEKYIGI